MLLLYNRSLIEEAKAGCNAQQHISDAPTKSKQGRLYIERVKNKRNEYRLYAVPTDTMSTLL